MTSRREVWAVAVAIVAATCASSPLPASAQINHAATAPPVVAVSEIKAAMLKAATAHIRGSATVDGTAERATLSGVARFPSGQYDVTGRCGSNTIANTATTHYRLSPKNGPTVNYWIDGMDRIVQMKWDSDDGEHDTEDFYNYGASVAKISAPSPAPKC